MSEPFKELLKIYQIVNGVFLGENVTYFYSYLRPLYKDHSIQESVTFCCYFIFMNNSSICSENPFQIRTVDPFRQLLTWLKKYGRKEGKEETEKQEI